jgi:hypothetical protein
MDIALTHLRQLLYHLSPSLSSLRRGPALRQNKSCSTSSGAAAAPAHQQPSGASSTSSTSASSPNWTALATRLTPDHDTSPVPGSQVGIGPGVRGYTAWRTSHWLPPGALRHVVQVHMTDDWQPLPAQQLTSLTSLLVYPSGSERMLTRVRSGSDHVPSSFRTPSCTKAIHLPVSFSGQKPQTWNRGRRHLYSGSLCTHSSDMI